MSYCYITKKNNGVYVDCSYDFEFLETLKRHIPFSDRKYDPATKQWWISEKFAAQAARDCASYFENVINC